MIEKRIGNRRKDKKKGRKEKRKELLADEIMGK